MIKLHEPTLTKLRDQMRKVALESQQDVVTSAGTLLADVGVFTAEEQRALSTLGPVFEILFLMMAADGELHPDETTVVVGAAAHLSSGFLGADTLGVLLDRYERMLREQGWELRLEVVSSALKQRPDLAEIAYALAGVVALADDRIDPREDNVLESLGEMLGIDESRAGRIFASLEHDWRGDTSSTSGH